MNRVMTIEEFNALMNSEIEQDDTLLKGLSELMKVEDPDEIASLAFKELGVWSNWGAV